MSLFVWSKLPTYTVKTVCVRLSQVKSKIKIEVVCL